MQSLDKINPRVYIAKLTQKAGIAENTTEFTFELEHRMEFLAGQYVWINLPSLKFPDPRGSRRPFSITSIPNEKNLISVIVRSTESGFNKSLRLLEKGDEIQIIGPAGSSFCLPDEPELPLLLISGGAGITPFLSLLRYSVTIQSLRPITLINVNSDPKRAFYVEELDQYNKNTGTIRTINLTKKLEYDDIKKVVKTAQDLLVYISGPQGFIDHVHELLRLDGVFEHQFRFEALYPSAKIDTELKQLFLEKSLDTGSIEESSTIKQRENLLRKLVESSATHAVVTDIHGHILFANRAAQKITGYSLSEMLGNTPRLWGGMMSKEFYKEMWKKKLKGGDINTEFINRRKDGELYITSSHASPIKNENGEIIGFISSEEDITHLRRAEQKANESEKKFIQLTERIPEVYWIVEMKPHEQVVYVSPAFEQIWGISREDLYRNSSIWTDQIHPDDRQRVGDLYKQFLMGKSEFDLEYRVVQRKSGKIINIHDQGERVLDKEGNLIRVVGVARDITREKLIDKEKTEFVLFASHQFKTPVSAIRWTLDTLLSGRYGQVTNEQKEALEGIYSLNLRIDELVSSLLSISRIESGVFVIEPTPANFKNICEEVLVEMEYFIAQKKHTLVKNIEEGIPMIPVDTKLLRIIFQNFISNAIKYTASEGKVSVSLKTSGNEIIFSVSNNGEPIPEADQPKIFSKMYRASNAQEQDPHGTGLGLYLTKLIIENAGGHVWFTSKRGEDTVFYVSFPLTGMTPKSA